MDINEELKRLHEHWFGNDPAQVVPDEKIIFGSRGARKRTGGLLRGLVSFIGP
jgi:hypothetical protein